MSVDPSVSGPLGSDRVAFLFPGQGAQHVGMARGLYDTEPVFAEHFDLCAEVFDAELDIDLRAEIFDGNARNLERTDRTQPALFTVEYAMAKLLESYGIHPSAMAGHCIGEYAAATLAGVFDVTTAARVVSMRARLMNAAPRGVMVAVASSPDAIAEYLTGDVDVAAINDPNACVVAGTDATIKAFTERLAAAGDHGPSGPHVTRVPLAADGGDGRRSSPAFLSRLTLRAPRIPLLSNVTGTVACRTARRPTRRPGRRQIRATVRFADELDMLLSDPSRVLVEVGPGGTLTASAMRHPKWSVVTAPSGYAPPRPEPRGPRHLPAALGQLWAAGVEVDWSRLAGRQASRRSSPCPATRSSVSGTGSSTTRLVSGWAGRRPSRPVPARTTSTAPV